ncbi:MAG: glycosyltransferase family 4 protein [Candidatus Acidiferrum sp.]
MKLLIYSHFFAPSVGGVETIVLSLARGLAGLRKPSGDAEFEITLATQTSAENFDDGLLPYRVVRQPNFIHLWDLIRECDAAHIAGPALAPLFLAYLARKAVVVEHHGYQAVCPNGLLLQRPGNTACPGHFLERNYRECVRCLGHESSALQSWATLLLMFPRHFFARRAAANLAVSNHSLKRCALPRSSVVYHGIEDPLESREPNAGLSVSGGKICFAYVGRLVPEKGVDLLLEASRLLLGEGHSFEIRLIGDGPERAKLEAIIDRDHLETCVQVTGFLTGAAFADALRDVRVVVMPSVWEETAGLAAMEQMMRGRLVIASDIGGLGEVLGDAGLKCPPGDPRALANAMRDVLQQPALVESFGKIARERALSLFVRDRMIAEHANVYRGLATSQKAPVEGRS